MFDLLKEAKRKSCSFEIGLYGKSKKVRDFCINAKDKINFNIHFDQIQTSLMQIDQYKDIFLKETKIGKSFGATYGVHHMAKYPMTNQLGYWDKMIDEVIKRMLRVEDICKDAEFGVYIENTFESIKFYRAVFESLQDTKWLNFCFDLGHAKVWSCENYEEWMFFLKELKQMGFKIHFHLHANHGLIDEHLSILEIADTCGNDGVFSNKTYKQMIYEIMTTYKEETKIFEVKPAIAIENLKHMSILHKQV